MKRELQLKELAPYLPYGLQVMQLIGGIDTECCLTSINIQTHLNKKSKPILRPMSDFHKSGLLGEYHYSYMSKFNRGVLQGWLLDKDLDFEIDAFDAPSYFPAKVAYDLYEFLFEHHFDVFGLIPVGLGIDINTLPNQS